LDLPECGTRDASHHTDQKYDGSCSDRESTTKAHVEAVQMRGMEQSE